MEFITLELTKKLKEKGFEYKRVSLYDKHKCVDTNYATPTIAQTLKWLREDKNIHIIVEISDSRWEDSKLKSDKYIMSFKNKNSYEEAALAGIEYVLDNLI